MLESLQLLAPDPILGLSALYRDDKRADKVDLGVGVFKDENGRTPVLKSVKRAEQWLLEEEHSKAYIDPAGVADFNSGLMAMTFGADHPAVSDGRVSMVQAPGGCGALRLAAELVKRARPEARVWVSDPTWANHMPLLGNAGLALTTYPYYSPAAKGVDFDAMLGALSGAQSGDLILLHGCCHNPCGADLSPEQWQAVGELCAKTGAVPFIDLAYQGFGEGLEPDAFGLRLMARMLPEVIITSSCSKNFGLYRDRVGALALVSKDPQAAAAAKSHALNLARGLYSMPPAHGGFIVGRILSDPALRTLWEGELKAMCGRINEMRALLGERLSAATGRDFSFITRERGMFSFLGLTAEQVMALREHSGVYMVSSSRINVAGITPNNVDHVANGVAAALAG
jgi:aspartate aminotransferase